MEKARGPLKRLLLAAALAGTPVPADGQTAPGGRSFDSSLSSTYGASGHLGDYVDLDQRPLSSEDIARERDQAIDELLQDLPRVPQLNYLRDRERLQAESQAYSPSAVEISEVTRTVGDELRALRDALRVGQFGLLGYATVTKEKREMHRLYVVSRLPDNRLRFIKAYRVSMAEKGFGNVSDSGMTPLGLQWISSGKEGFLGEVIPIVNKHSEYFKRTYVSRSGTRHLFVSDFGHETITEPATVVTDRYTIDARRGIHLHGSNRTGRWKFLPDGTRVWHSFLDGTRRSGACGRMANADIRDLGRHYLRSRESGRALVATPVYIYATQELRGNIREEK